MMLYRARKNCSFEPYQKSDPEHGKLLKKVMGPSDVKMFIGGLSHETTTQKLWDYFAQWGEGTCSTEHTHTLTS